jgi:hypothetical protein
MPAGADAATPFHTHPPPANVCSCRGWWLATGFEYAWQVPDPEPDEGPGRGLTWRQLTLRHWSVTWDSKTRGTVTRYGDGWVAYLRLEDPPGLSPITIVGRSTPSRRRSRYRRGVGGEVTHTERLRSACS